MNLHRIIAVLSLPNTVPGVLKAGEGIVQAMTGNGSFPTPLPTLTTVSADLSSLNAAEILASTRASSSITARDAKLRIVVSDLHQLRGYVQGVADANLDNAAHVIESAGMAVKKPGVVVKPPLSVKQGAVSGAIVIVARAAARTASYEWGWSLDQKTWTSLPSTLQAKTHLEGLTPGGVVSVRMRALLRTGPGDWGQPVSLLVK